ncbi:MAG: imidazole glycerol phosphate synthase subunit HisF [Candidatus Obscuribacterales bacterium]
MSAVGETGLCKRIIACLDIAGGRTVKGVNFQNLRDAGDPAELSLLYEELGADEIVFLDITATNEGRKTTIDLVRRVAGRLSIPLTVGGGVSTIDDVEALLAAGADKVSVNTAAVRNPALIDEIAGAFGSQCCVVAIDARARAVEGEASSGSYQVLIKGGREALDLDALTWARECVDRGAGEIMLTSWDRDGSRSGFDIEMTRAFSSLPVPVIASGGAAGADCFVDVFKSAGADAALAASIFHYSICTVDEIKKALEKEGVPVRPC